MPDQVAQGMAFMQAVLESARDAILVCNSEGIVTHWTDAAADLFGYSAQEIVGHPVTTLTPSNRLDEERPMLDRIVLGEPISDWRTQRLRKDGQLVEVYLSVTPVLDETTIFSALYTLFGGIRKGLSLTHKYYWPRFSNRPTMRLSQKI